MLCFEMFWGRLPLEDVSVDRAEQMISSGEFVIPEKSFSDVVAEMIRLCWNIDLWDRPTWEYIIGVLSHSFIC